MDDVTSPARCARCGADIPVDAPGGQCPRCLISLVLDGETLGDGDTTYAGTSSAGGVGARPAPGQLFGPYRIEKLLGRGGMGEVYAATHVEHGRRVAVKVLTARLGSPADRARFLLEGQLAASINHPHSVYIFGSEEIAGMPVITMELLPGGTLKDKVVESGPLAPAAAVDAVLDMVGGLDAAHSVGVLHRDIKPSNCFVDHDGTVKIGDFGLSISTMAREVTERSGVFQGTPQFAAPEQLNGEALDVRADIYAVGATLFYLLTGRAPFDATDLTTLVDRVRQEPPSSPREIIPLVSKPLADVVLQCLSKEPSMRPATYAALQDALRPFSSAVARAATLRSRVGAAIVDLVLLALPLRAVISVMLLSSGSAGVPSLPSWWWLFSSFVYVGYFTLTEGIAGASLGKRIFNLQVRSIEGGAPSVVRVLVRSAAFVCGVSAVGLVPVSFWNALFLGPPPRGVGEMLARSTAMAAVVTFVSVLRLLSPLILFLPARARNGFSGLHELISGTRVTVAGPEVLAHEHSRAAASPIGDIGGLPERGPFVLVKPLAADSSMWLGFDRVLKRHVWIRESPDVSSLSGTARRDVSRSTRLRWLAGQTSQNGRWEAFEAPDGRPLLSMLAEPQPWTAVRQWLADLTDECARSASEQPPPSLGLDRVWVRNDNRAMLLDFRSPGAEVNAPASGNDGTFLYDVGMAALTGSTAPTGGALRARPPLPVAGTAFLNAVRAASWTERIDEARELSREALAGPARVTRWSRALLPCVAAALAATMVIGLVPVLSRFHSFAEVVPQDDRVLRNGLVEVDRLQRAKVPSSDPDRQALEIYIARRFAPVDTRTEQSGSLSVFRPLAREIAGRHGRASDDDFMAAIRRIGPERLDALGRPARGSDAAFVIRPVLKGLAVIGLLALTVAFVTRGGLALLMFRIAVVDTLGAQVPRWRATLRAACAWSPLMVFWLLPERLRFPFDTSPALAWAEVVLTLGTMIAGTMFSIRAPSRSLQDRIVGTWLVPR